MKTQTKAERLADRRVEEAYRRHCCGFQINIMDLAKVFAFGRRAVAQGQDDDELGASLRVYVHSISKNQELAL